MIEQIYFGSNHKKCTMEHLDNILDYCERTAFDLNFTRAKDWKKAGKDRLLVGYLPIYVPREMIHAANGMAVGIMGAGDRKQIIKGDAYYQSYICHMPRGIIEMALDTNLHDIDGFLFPAICDCIRNLSGMFKLSKKGSFQRYFDYPQNFDSHIGGIFYRQEMEKVLDDMKSVNGVEASTESLNAAIGLYNTNRRLIEEIYAVRQQYPWRLSAVETYYILRAGIVMPVEEHNEILKQVLEHISSERGEPMDNIRVVVTGSFCEQPPIGLIKSIEMAGCYIVDDDFMLGSRWIQGDIDDTTDDPLTALTEAYIHQSTFSSAYYDVGNPKGKRLVSLARQRNADGVIFCAASFCDPALLDRPQMQKECDDAGLPHINFQFHENTGQFKVIKEQAGTFSDSIKLWV
ncbi:MAG: benzoyl-CoA reductase subunit C [Chlorobi bacterium]|nr:MAG: benzoyl-CoA reductase subunit C [Bacteroidota bacterium]KXK35957.1 MAG: Benzoyl-CoA reductase subunit C [Chlorobi bacterium OLB6]MBE2265987.1 benzoyl-CoA reductase subunit C [Flavobacteriales bacterium]MBL1161429.1 benzoyl-CoA reductase subunit C [Chlorobiota bacterium]MBW7854014.1 benzoyl-CoA reductase subunit C [Candidatus Kapabacteria bacterium]MCL4277408.1 benzoyl-CoA reductase subunit C [Ignavibacteria bacterium]